MKNLCIDLTNEEILPAIDETKPTLIQLFCGELERFEYYSTLLKEHYPKATLIGASTDGEIAANKILTHHTIAIITTFDKTRLKALHTYHPDSSILAEEIATQLKGAKHLIAFSEAFSVNEKTLLDTLWMHNLSVSGGLAGDNGEFKQTYVMYDGKVYTQGVVAVGLFSEDLLVDRYYRFGWKKIGPHHFITKAVANRVYEIDGMRAVDFYGKYLGEKIASKLPEIGVEFPLIIEEDGIQKARAPLYRYEDGSLLFPADIPEGTPVYLGIGDTNQLIDSKKNLPFRPEAVFLYSCMARRRFLQDFTIDDIHILPEGLQACGFFTYGEFFSDKKNHLFNETVTYLFLSEQVSPPLSLHSLHAIENREFKALFHLIEEVTKEYEELTRKLSNQITNLSHDIEEKDIQITALLDNMKEGFALIEKDGTIRMVNRTFSQILRRQKESIIGKKIDHFFSIEIDGAKREILLELDSRYFLVNIVPFGEEQYICTFTDVTDIRQKDRLLMQQAKLAQMGEMINMIAHQWRQPLNLISTLSIQLEMKNELDLLSKEDIASIASKIHHTVQEMSQTIDQFLSFAKPSHKKEYFSLSEVIKEALSMFGAQFKAHNISVEKEIKEHIFLQGQKNDLLQIIINILSNARDALDERNPPSKWIKITIERDRFYARISIEDSAGGIDPELIDRIFEPYFTTKLHKDGIGIGLHMSRLLAKRLGGDLSVTNTENGAKFILQIPLMESVNGK